MYRVHKNSPTFETLSKLFRDFFETSFFGGGRPFFLTVSGFGARRARETPVRFQMAVGLPIFDSERSCLGWWEK